MRNSLWVSKTLLNFLAVWKFTRITSEVWVGEPPLRETCRHLPTSTVYRPSAARERSTAVVPDYAGTRGIKYGSK